MHLINPKILRNHRLGFLYDCNTQKNWEQWVCKILGINQVHCELCENGELD